MRCRRYTFRLFEKRASPTQWSKTLPVTVGESPGLQQACGRLHNTFLAQQRLSCQHVPQSTRNAAAQKYLYIVNDAHVTFECVGVRQKLAADAGQHSELLVCFAVREVLLADASRRYIASVLPRSSPVPHWCPHDEKANLRLIPPRQSSRLRDPSMRSNQQMVWTWRDRTHQDKSTNGCVKTMWTPRESTLIKLCCVSSKEPCRAPRRHSAPERGERTSTNHISMQDLKIPNNKTAACCDPR